ncbi:MAG: hypothetical protein M3290_04500 [Actinomycetota bacterium]|nr:hypothetical protein [Actinomycetota bacterium]
MLRIASFLVALAAVSAAVLPPALAAGSRIAFVGQPFTTTINQLGETECTYGSKGVFSVDPGGDHAHRVTTSPGDALYVPTWSLDKSHLAFVAGDGPMTLYVVVANGSHLHAVAQLPSIQTLTGPTWSPNSQWLSFSGQKGGTQDVWVVKRDGSHLHRLTHDRVVDIAPSWAPDGKHVLFSRHSPSTGLYEVSRTGIGLHIVVRHQDAGPSEWSAAANDIMFLGGSPKGHDIFMVRPDGSHLRRVSDFGDVPENGIDLSPDGRWVAFLRSRESGSKLYTVKVDGSHLKLLQKGGFPYGPTWSPDSRWIAYQSVVKGPCAPGLKKINRAGTRDKRISPGLYVVGAPTWR